MAMLLDAKVARYLASPSRLANSLDWKRRSSSVLSLCLDKNCIRLALGRHPSLGKATNLKPIPLEFRTSARNRKVPAQRLLDELQTTLEQHRVCGFLVSWPIQKEGRLGAPCGRVLHLLEALDKADPSIFSTSRPFCLWDSNHITPLPHDEWGRCPIYGRTCTRTTEHYASIEQYAPEACDALTVWADFCKLQWPETRHQRLLSKNREPKQHERFQGLNQFIADYRMGNPQCQLSL